MPYITEVTVESELNAALTLFNQQCILNSAALSLTPAALVEIAAMATGFNTAFTAVVAVKATAKSTVETKEIQKKASKATLSKYAKTFRANPAISDALLDQLMLPHHKTPGTKTPPTTPLNLQAVSNVQGLVTVSWSRNGNKSTTQFIVEIQTSLGGAWSFAGSTTKTKLQQQVVLGNYVAFRVYATRDGQQSAPTQPVVLWANGGGGNLAIAA